MSAQSDLPAGDPIGIGPGPMLLKPLPLTTAFGGIGPQIVLAGVSDVEILDFNGDGRNEIAVVWHATDFANLPARQRFLTFFEVDALGLLVRTLDIDLFIPGDQAPCFVPGGHEDCTTFRFGASDMAVGDFDGDGDPDLAIAAFFGDEIWLIENLGAWNYAAHLKFTSGTEGGGLLNPPQMEAADFDGDGRDELVFLVDETKRLFGTMLQFWRTDDSVANMSRVAWEGLFGGLPMFHTRSMTIADFDGDGRPDVAFTGALEVNPEDGPIVAIWHNLDTTSRLFEIQNLFPSFIASDIVAMPCAPGCPASFVVADLADGRELEVWTADCNDPTDFNPVTDVSGFAGISADRGMTLVAADVNEDSYVDILCRQRAGSAADLDQVQLAIGGDLFEELARFTPAPMNTAGLVNDGTSQLLRPTNLAIGDLVGNRLPEVVAAFNPVVPSGQPVDFQIALWRNSCIGDVDRDGTTSISDMAALLGSFGCTGEYPDADLNRDGCVNISDLAVLLIDFGCN